MSSAAAPMIGVASRNAKRAASSLREADQQAARHRRAGAREAGDRARAPARRRRRSRRATRPRPRSARRRRPASGARRAPAQPLGAVEHDAVHASGRTPRSAPRRTRRAARARAAARAARPGSCRRPAASRAARPRRRRRSRGRRSDRPQAAHDPHPVGQKNPSRTSAVARCVATRKVMKKSSFWWMSQPSSCGRITLWPRLEIGNSSLNPCSRPSTTAWPYEIGPRESAASGAGGAPGLEPGEDEAADAEEQRGDAVLDVVV